MAHYVVDNPTLKAENPPPPGTSPIAQASLRRNFSQVLGWMAFMDEL